MGLNFTTATESHSAHIFYVLQNCKKGQIPEKGFPLFKNDIKDCEPAIKMLDSRNHHNFYFVISYYVITEISVT
jgi:hypothetical protein